MSWFRRTPHQRVVEKVLPHKDRSGPKKPMSNFQENVGVSKIDSASNTDKNDKKVTK